MLLYNVTIGIDRPLEEEWLSWMKSYYIPKVMQTEMFADSRIYKILHDEGEDTVSYSVQYFATSIQHIREYLDVHAPSLIEEHRAKFKDRHVVFQTLLQEV